MYCSEKTDLEKSRSLILSVYIDSLVDGFVEVNNPHFPFFANFKSREFAFFAPFPNGFFGHTKKLRQLRSAVNFVLFVSHSSSIIPLLIEKNKPVPYTIYARASANACALVAQRIEHWSSEPVMWVQFLPRAMALVEHRSSSLGGSNPSGRTNKKTADRAVFFLRSSKLTKLRKSVSIFCQAKTTGLQSN